MIMNVKMLDYLLLIHIVYHLLILDCLNLFQDQMDVSAKDQNMDLLKQVVYIINCTLQSEKIV